MLLGFLIIVVFSITAGWSVTRWAQRDSQDAAPLPEKIIVTTILLLIIFYSIPIYKVFAPFFIVACGIILSLVWTPDVAQGIFGSAFSTFDGGSEAPEKMALLSTAQAMRRKGKPAEAIEKVQEEMEKFPEDYACQMLIAEIQAEDLKDIASARYTIEDVMQQKKHTVSQKAAALNTLADWLLSKQRDPVAARIVLERIATLNPGTELAQRAQQRIARLPSVEMLATRDHSPGIEMRKGHSDLGLKPRPLLYVDKDPTEEAAELVMQLERHPQDFAAREQLAILYAQKLGHLEAAEVELEQLIQQPLVEPKQVVAWLCLLADLQVRVGGNVEKARQTLHRIVERFPGTALAQQARKQMEYVSYDRRPQIKEPGTKPGSLEDDLSSGPPG